MGRGIRFVTRFRGFAASTDRFTVAPRNTGRMSNPLKRARIAAFTIGVLAVPAVIGAVGRIVEWRTSGASGSPWICVVNGVVPWATWMVLTPLVIVGARRLPVAPPLRARVLLAHFVISLLLGQLYISVGVLWTSHRTGTPLVQVWSSFLSFVFPISIVLYAAVVLAIGWFDSDRRLREQRLAQSRADARVSRARLAALRAQLRPHFLFNALNSISALVRHDDRERAVQLIARLGDLLRRVLAADRRVEIPLATELDLVADYLDIERARLGSRFEVRIETPSDIRSALVPALVLQPLVENAVIHGIAPVSQRARLSVRAARRERDLILEVENDGAPLAQDSTRRGVGLRNVSARLAELYGDGGGLELIARDGGGCRAVVRLPWHDREDEA